MTDAELIERIRGDVADYEIHWLAGHAADRLSTLSENDKIQTAEIMNLQERVDELENARAADRREWIDHMRALGPLLKQAQAEGALDTLIEANIWPLPKCALTEADVQRSIEIARRIRPQIEAEHPEFSKE